MRTASLSAIILAGGHSRRMGQDKALLTLPNGQPLLQRTAQIAQQLTSDTLVVTPWPERYQPILSPTVRLVKEQTASHAQPTPQSTAKAFGPLGGFAQGWSLVRSDWCLLLACDLPYLEPDPLRQWWQWLIALPPDHLSLSVPTTGEPSADLKDHNAPIMASLAPGTKGWEPLCGYYHRSCLPGLHRHIAGHDRSFQSWLTTIPIAAYCALPATLLFNCNTPHDWANVK
ncbi:MAG: NTP transferase domain-containing protein [Phormidesmis sp.]